jgi:ankyrin repeat protein
MRRFFVAAMVSWASIAVAAAQTSNGESGTHSEADELLPPVAKAVIDGNMKDVKDLVQKEPQVINEEVHAKKGDMAGFTPIMLAAALSNAAMVKYLMSEKADITRLDADNRSVFWYAAFNGDTEVTKIVLLSAGRLDVNKVINTADSDLMRTPLHLAVRRNEPQLVRILVDAGASDESKDISGETPVQFCKRNRTVACLELLKLKGVP